MVMDSDISGRCRERAHAYDYLRERERGGADSRVNREGSSTTVDPRASRRPAVTRWIVSSCRMEIPGCNGRLASDLSGGMHCRITARGRMDGG